MPHTLGNVKMT